MVECRSLTVRFAPKESLKTIKIDCLSTGLCRVLQYVNATHITSMRSTGLKNAQNNIKQSFKDNFD